MKDIGAPTSIEKSIKCVLGANLSIYGVHIN